MTQVLPPPFRKPLLDITGRSLAVFLAGCALAFYVGRQFPAGEWKSSGNGVTIMNTATGELRYSHTGEGVEEARIRREAEAAAEKAELAKKQRALTIDDLFPKKQMQGTMTREEFESSNPGRNWWDDYPIAKPDPK